jgi:tol-pal system protein YbgF
MRKQIFLAALFACASFAAPASSREAAIVNPVPESEVSTDGLVQLAQAGDAAFRVNQLEEQVRRLNGQLEDINFQLLQLQEQLRKMQEDNEFRFQELEGNQGSLNTNTNVAERRTTPDESRQAAQPLSPSSQGAGDDIARMIERGGGEQSKTIDGVEIYDGNSDQGSGDGNLQPGTLGSLTFDEEGNVTNSDLDAPIDLTRSAGGGNPAAQQVPGSGDQAMLQQPQGPDELYELGYGYVQAGDYQMAEQTFADFSERYPSDPRYAEARFWLGESLHAQAQYEEAARVFLDAHKKYPQSRLGAQTLLKLASSLAGMNQREMACATFAEVPKKYPGMSNAVRSNLEQGRRAASCQIN